MEDNSLPKVNWDHVNKKYVYLACGDTACHLFTHKPVLVGGAGQYVDWVIPGAYGRSEGSKVLANVFESFEPGYSTSEYSLVERPS